MIIENPDAFYEWLMSCLARLCDADPAALAKYVMALIKKDKPEGDLKEFCSDQLEVFLQKETKPFVEVLFKTLEEKSYIQQNMFMHQNFGGNCAEYMVMGLNGSTNMASVLSLQSSLGLGSAEVEMTADSEVVNSAAFTHTSKSLFVSSDSSPTYINRGDDAFNKDMPESLYSADCKIPASINETTVEHPGEAGPSEHLEHSDKDYRTHSIPTFGQSLEKKPNALKRQRVRCADYDEKGYCMQGDLCLYDHGTDPLVVDNVSSLKLGPTSQVSTCPPSYIQSTSMPKSDDKGSPPLPPSPPPLPPLPIDTPAGVIEPYNPESPLMYNRSGQVWVPQSSGVKDVSEPYSIEEWKQSLPMETEQDSSAPQCSAVDVISYELNKPVPYHSNPKRSRMRELIGVPTIDKTDYKEKTFDFSRLGTRQPTKRNYENCSLQLRKIPRNLNSINSLYEHFSKFGVIITVQVCYNNDPEAALIQFSNHSEALAAYRNSDPVLNNRFIKVFWHIPEKDNIEFSTNLSQNTDKKNLWEDNDPPTIEEQSVYLNEGLSDNLEIDRTSYLFKRGTSKVIYDPASLRKTNVPPQPSSKPRRFKDDKYKETMQKRLELHNKKQSFLQLHIDNQKMMLDKLTKAKTQKEKEFIKKVMDDLQEKIINLQNELKKEAEELVSMKNNPDLRFLFTKKTEAEKQILDAELDLYNKEQKGDDVSDLKNTVKFLKENALSLYENSPHSSPQHMPKFNKRSVTSNYFDKPSTWSRSIDYRPRKLKILNFPSPDRDTLQSHFSKFGEVLSLDVTETGASVTFRTRRSAELAFSFGSKLDETVLDMEWCTDNEGRCALSEPSAVSAESDKSEEEQEEEEDDDDEEEEVSEARSWRR